MSSVLQKYIRKLGGDSDKADISRSPNQGFDVTHINFNEVDFCCFVSILHIAIRIEYLMLFVTAWRLDRSPAQHKCTPGPNKYETGIIHQILNLKGAKFRHDDCEYFCLVCDVSNIWKEIELPCNNQSFLLQSFFPAKCWNSSPRTKPPTSLRDPRKDCRC